MVSAQSDRIARVASGRWSSQVVSSRLRAWISGVRTWWFRGGRLGIEHGLTASSLAGALSAGERRNVSCAAWWLSLHGNRAASVDDGRIRPRHRMCLHWSRGCTRHRSGAVDSGSSTIRREPRSLERFRRAKEGASRVRQDGYRHTVSTQRVRRRPKRCARNGSEPLELKQNTICREACSRPQAQRTKARVLCFDVTVVTPST